MKVKFITLGCKTNQYETNAMEQNFIKNGYQVIDKNGKSEDKEIQCTEIADIYIINTCSVTNIAERKSRQMIRKARELNPNAIIVACGCYAQVAKKELEKIEEVDLILGINEKNNIFEIIKEYINNQTENQNKTKSQKEFKSQDKLVSDVMHKNEYEDFGTTTYTEFNRAIVKIQDGCDRFCTYCVIPYARGKVRSRNPESILKEIEEISKRGIKEVVLTGIHIASYGKDFSEEKTWKLRKEYNYSEEYNKFDAKEDLSSGGFRLIELLEQINKINGIERIRIGSLEPKIINKEFVNRLIKLEKMCDHFHLSLQSGCDEILKRMNRRYTTLEFKESTNILRKAYPNLLLTTDIIVGFPGETDEEFDKTYQFLKEIKFYKMHIFKYSPKKGTKAELMPNQINGNEKEQRSKKLIELSNEIQQQYNKDRINKIESVLFEEKEGFYYKGHSTNYMVVKVKDENNNLVDKICDVKITGNDGLELIGKTI